MNQCPRCKDSMDIIDAGNDKDNCRYWTLYHCIVCDTEVYYYDYK